MTKIRILAATLLAAVSLGTMSTANAVVPGSDTYERAAENRAIQSVITGEAAGRGVVAGETRAFGYPNTRQSGQQLVPGSSYFNDEADSRSLNSVIRGIPEGIVGTPTAERGRLVPGSDSY
ncbi:hypothetical protein [Aureimonas sp. AU4]|uniref:hypothetical protein n=1 Tax=Aureimonas sp. AU4 TaxID=1638163 RepID=UPI0007812BA4|nr:hypothetical protein [Aureimonas sp. AU4]